MSLSHFSTNVPTSLCLQKKKLKINLRGYVTDIFQIKTVITSTAIMSPLKEYIMQFHFLSGGIPTLAKKNIIDRINLSLRNKHDIFSHDFLGNVEVC